MWAYIKLAVPLPTEQCAILGAVHPALQPLLPTAMAALALVQLAAGQLHQQQQEQQRGEAAAWLAVAAAALQGAGLRPGDLALHMGRCGRLGRGGPNCVC